jgi:hypothetical protein
MRVLALPTDPPCLPPARAGPRPSCRPLAKSPFVSYDNVCAADGRDPVRRIMRRLGRGLRQARLGPRAADRRPMACASPRRLQFPFGSLL